MSQTRTKKAGPTAAPNPINNELLSMKESAPMSQSHKRALVVAINDYGGTGSNNLPSCLNDANAFTDEVLKRSFGFNPSDVHTLFDGHATVDKLESEIDWLVKDAKADDRLVFYYSGHGFTRLDHNLMEEYLVLRDAAGAALYDDNRFVARLKSLPEGVLTVVLDMCFSGGAFKNIKFNDGAGTFEPTLVKALPYPPEALQKKAFNIDTAAGPIAYKRFGCQKTDRPAVLSKAFGLEAATALARPKAMALSDPTEAPQPELAGLLISACLETETASASNSRTRGLSAFTYAMLDAMKGASTNRSAVDLFNATAAQLKSAGFQQTPMILERATPGNLRDRAFITGGAVGIAPAIRKDFEPVDEKLFGAILGRLAQVIPQVAPAVFDAIAGRHKALAAGPGTATSAAGEADEKFIGAVLGTLAQVLPRVAPVVLDAILSRRKALELQPAASVESSAEADEKFLGAVLETVAQCIPHVAPVILDAIAGRRKAFEGAGSVGLEADPKFFGAVLGAVARVIPQVAPILINAVAGRRKELDQMPSASLLTGTQADEKFLGAILGTLAQVIPHVAPLVVNAIAGRRKALGGFGAVDTAPDFETDEKFLGAIFETFASAVPFVAPRIVDIVAGRPKALEGVSAAGPLTEADEKFLGAILGTIAQVIPHVAPLIVNAVAGRRKEFELAAGVGATTREEADEKFLGLVISAAASIIPHVAPIIVDAIRGRRKELEEVSILGASTTPIADEKFFGEILRRVRQVLPAITAVAPTGLQAVASQRKDFEFAETVAPPIGATTELADEKFFGAVLAALGQVIPVVAPAIVDAIRSQRKELTIAPPMASSGLPTEADEKFFGAVLNTLGRILPVVAPVIVNTITRRKELGSGQPNGETRVEVDEKMMREILNRLPEAMPQWFAAAPQPAYRRYTSV